MIKLLADENVHYDIVADLRKSGELAELLKNEEKTFESARTLLVVLSENRYRIHRP